MRPARPPKRPPRITGKEAVHDLVERTPGLRLALLSHGICGCCVGDARLADAAAQRGVDLNSLLRELNALV